MSRKEKIFSGKQDISNCVSRATKNLKHQKISFIAWFSRLNYVTISSLNYPKFITHFAFFAKVSNVYLHRDTKVSLKETHSKATGKCHSNTSIETIVVCDESCSGIREAIEQPTLRRWKPIAFKSHLLSGYEERYGINKSEQFRLVWSIEFFNNYLYGQQFAIIIHHRALLSVVKEHLSSRSNNSRLTILNDRLQISD